MSSHPLSIDLVLVLADQSEEATRTAEHAVVVAVEYDATVHAIHVLGEGVVRVTEQGTVDEDTVAENGKVVTDTVSALAKTADMSVTTSVAYGFSQTSKLHHPGSVVLDTAKRLDTNLIVVSRGPVSGDSGEVLAEAAEYVLLYAG